LQLTLSDAGNAVAESRTSLLIVDDEPYVLSALSAALQQNFQVVTAASAEEALQILSRGEVDLILSDQRLPGMTGVQLLEWVRIQHPRTVRMLMTGYAQVDDAVEAINRGQVYRFLFKPWRVEELLQALMDAAKAYRMERDHARLWAELKQLNQELEQRVEERTRELEEANKQLQHRNSMLEKLALTDALTGLPNRRAIDQILQSEIRRRTRYPAPLAVALIDADHFKDVNTRYLFTGGDQVLVHLARTMTSSLRGVDSVGRLGGDEFLLIAPVTGIEGAEALGERIRQSAEQMVVDYQGQRIQITVSIGLAIAEAEALVNAAELTHQAAFALAEAKKAGRNRCVYRLIRAAGCKAASLESA
jgi:diguanylate cyclase (GGDEF)-like protein